MFVTVVCINQSEHHICEVVQTDFWIRMMWLLFSVLFNCNNLALISIF